MIYMQKRGLREIITSISCDLMGHDGLKVFYEFTLVSLYVMLKWLNLCLIYPLLRLSTSIRIFWNIRRSVKSDRYNNFYPLGIIKTKKLNITKTIFLSIHEHKSNTCLTYHRHQLYKECGLQCITWHPTLNLQLYIDSKMASS